MLSHYLNLPSQHILHVEYSKKTELVLASAAQSARSKTNWIRFQVCMAKKDKLLVDLEDRWRYRNTFFCMQWTLGGTNT